jgi:hypothetical protein
VCSIYSTKVYSQEKDILTKEELRVKTTTRWAACLPGSGQVINRKIWKVPFVLGGLATSGWFIVDNTKQMNLFLEHWGYETDDDPNTSSTLINIYGGLYTESQLKDGAYVYRRNRDLSYLAFLGVYILQIVDANVDSHMKFFDASEDLSWEVIPPQLTQTGIYSPWQLGISLRINNNDGRETPIKNR